MNGLRSFGSGRLFISIGLCIDICPHFELSMKRRKENMSKTISY